VPCTASIYDQKHSTFTKTDHLASSELLLYHYYNQISNVSLTCYRKYSPSNEIISNTKKQPLINDDSFFITSNTSCQSAKSKQCHSHHDSLSKLETGQGNVCKHVTVAKYYRLSLAQVVYSCLSRPLLTFMLHCCTTKCYLIHVSTMLRSFVLRVHNKIRHQANLGYQVQSCIPTNLAITPFLGSPVPNSTTGVAINHLQHYSWAATKPSEAQQLSYRGSFERRSDMLHVHIPPEFQQHGKVAHITTRVHLACRHIVAAVPRLCRTDVMQHLCVFTIPTIAKNRY